MNLAFRFLTALVLVTLVGCGGDDEKSTPLAQRVLSAKDVPGSKPDPVEVRQTADDLDEFSKVFSDFSSAPDEDEIDAVFKKAGFEGAILDSRFIGDEHSGEVPHVIGWVVQTKSDDGATSALDFLEEDLKKPCPESCAVVHADFKVDGIPGARGVRSSATLEDIKRIGTPDQRPFESYWVGFTDGSYATTVELHGAPGSVSEEAALKIAMAYYERVAN